jgi:hypothetical protein
MVVITRTSRLSQKVRTGQFTGFVFCLLVGPSILFLVFPPFFWGCFGLFMISLNPVPNAQVCVFDSTYYKITTTNYISKTSLYITFRMYSLGP